MRSIIIMKQREVTNSAKGGNLIASLCKISYFPKKYVFLFEMKNTLFKFLEHLPYIPRDKTLFQSKSTDFLLLFFINVCYGLPFEQLKQFLYIPTI